MRKNLVIAIVVILLAAASAEVVRAHGGFEWVFRATEDAPHAAPHVLHVEPDEWGEESRRGWRLAIMTPKRVYDVGEEIPIIIVHNHLQEAMGPPGEGRDVGSKYIDYEYEFDVTDDALAKRYEQVDAGPPPTETEEQRRRLLPGLADRKTRYGERYMSWDELAGGLQQLSQVPLRSGFREEPLHVPSGKSIVRRVRLNAIWDMTFPATYTITVRARTRELSEDGESYVYPHNLLSNTLEIEVRDFGFEAFFHRAGRRRR